MPRFSALALALILSLPLASRAGSPSSNTGATASSATANSATSTAAGPTAYAPEYAGWQTLLSRYLDTAAADGIHRFCYSAVTPADKASLDELLAALQATRVSALPSDAQRAFWINLYNARTVACVLKAYPIKSIRDIKAPGSAAPGPWDGKALQVEGRRLSLNDIESGILRKQWRDKRIHFALNCASLGCPNLSARAFTAGNLEAQLDQGAREFLRSRRGAEFIGGKSDADAKPGAAVQGNIGATGAKGGTLRLSSIFDWYKEDFGKSDAEVLAALGGLAGDEMGKKLKDYKGKIEYQYDWSLNGI